MKILISETQLKNIIESGSDDFDFRPSHKIGNRSIDKLNKGSIGSKGSGYRDADVSMFVGDSNRTKLPKDELIKKTKYRNNLYNQVSDLRSKIKNLENSTLGRDDKILLKKLNNQRKDLIRLMQSIEDSNNSDETMRQWEISKNKEKDKLNRKEEQKLLTDQEKRKIEKETIHDIFEPIRVFDKLYADKPYSFSFMKEQGLLNEFNKLIDEMKKKLESSYKEGLISLSTYQYYSTSFDNNYHYYYERIFMRKN
jgi:hypothetical protein